MLSLDSRPEGAEQRASPAPDRPDLPFPEAEYQFTLQNDLGELRRMSEWLERCGRELRISPRRIDELDLCANEAVTNVISYAYDAPGKREIVLRLKRAQSAGASLSIEDDGRPFDPTAAPEPVPPARLADAVIGGLGIKLMRRMMARCDYQRKGGRNLFTLVTHA